MQFDELNNRLTGIRDASRKGYPIRDLYRLMCKSKDIWKLAYANIYANKGAITKGIDDNTLSGFSMSRVENIIQALKEQRYKFKPVRRIHIPKKNGSLRPLGIATGDDKLVGEVGRIILERIYEPVFSNWSHGFRPHRSCHTALEQIQHAWTGVKWLIEIDIEKFFDTVNHKIMVNLLKNKIRDKGFLQLIKAMLKAGYLQDWKFHNTYSGTPQGGISSPMLSNIYLHELDKWIEEFRNEFDVGKTRPANPEYNKLAIRRCRIRKKIDKVGKYPELIKEHQKLGKAMRQIPSGITSGGDYKRLRYCRYADDFLIGIIGTKADANTVKRKTEGFLEETLALKISEDKSEIVHAEKGVQFLSYHVHTRRSGKELKMKIHGSHTTRRTVTGGISLQVPRQKLIDFNTKYGYGDWYQNEPKHRTELMNSSDVEIITTYNAELRGLANYYSLADDMKAKLGKLFYLATYSLTKTLAGKHKTKQTTILKKLKQGNELIYRYNVSREERKIKVFKLQHIKPNANELDEMPNPIHLVIARTEMVHRLNAQQCEYCGRTDMPVQVHHVGKLKDLKDKKNLLHWQKVLIARNRKTIFLCSSTKESCHYLLHSGKLPDNRYNFHWGNPQ